jgi:hypothetical protein
MRIRLCGLHMMMLLRVDASNAFDCPARDALHEDERLFDEPNSSTSPCNTSCFPAVIHPRHHTAGGTHVRRPHGTAGRVKKRSRSLT